MHRLREQGHEVVSIGKLHYRSAGDDVGFSESMLPMYLANDGKGWPQGLQRKPLAEFPEAVEMASNLGPGESSYTGYDREITRTAIDWLQQRKGKTTRPWVLFVSFVSPHFPLTAPREFYDLYRDAELPEPYDCDNWLRHPVMDAMRKFWCYADFFDKHSEIRGLRNYYGLCSFLDSNVEQVLGALQGSGLEPDTQIIYTSDHGDMIGNHGIWGKSYMYEDSVGVPLILAGPGIGTSVNPTPVSLTDIGATVEQLVGGVDRRDGQDWQGRSLLHYIDNPDAQRPLISEYHDGGSPCGFYMLRQGRWKYVHFAEDNPALLFDLEQDPREMNNLASEPGHEAHLRRMRETLLRILDPERVNREAFADQAKMIEKLGGLDEINALPGFNHTPLESSGS